MTARRMYTLGMCKEYVAHWGVVEAARELIQNALDSDSPFEWEHDEGTLILHSRNTKLHPRTLLMGATTKCDGDDKIGSFGEGYKLALLVLTRCERPTTLYNEGEVWKPRFKWSSDYEADVLCITVTTSSIPSPQQQGLSFVVENLLPEEMEAIIDSCLYMQADLGRVLEATAGRILLDRPGKLFVGGLYICETPLVYGYDIKPEFITLGRDRKAVDSWDLKWIAKDMWFSADRPEEVAKMMEQDIPDVEYGNYSTPTIVRDACYRLFQEKYDGKIAVTTQSELDALVRRGMTDVVIVNTSFHGAVTGSAGYNHDMKKLRPRPTPQRQLKSWLKRNKGGMSAPAVAAFTRLVKRSEEWIIK